MSDCLFCQLIKEQKVSLVYEDELTVAFPDISPKAPIHVLIVPKEHIDSVNSVEKSHKSTLGHLFSVARRVASDQKINESGYRLVVNTGSDAGQSVHHIHMHVLAGEPLGRMNTVEPA